MDAEGTWAGAAAPQAAEHAVVIPLWLARAFLALALLLAPWIVYLAVSLPGDTTATHWDLAWAGLDVALAAALAATGVAILRRSPWVAPAAAATATLLVVDAWFDVVTASSRGKLAVALAEAILCELPLALVCVWVARTVERLLRDARDLLVTLGVEVVDGRLVAPPGIVPDRSAAAGEPAPDR